MVLTIVKFMDTCHSGATNVRYTGDYHVLRTAQFMDTCKNRRCMQFMDTAVATDACVSHAFNLWTRVSVFFNQTAHTRQFLGTLLESCLLAKETYLYLNCKHVVWKKNASLQPSCTPLM